MYNSNAQLDNHLGYIVVPNYAHATIAAKLDPKQTNTKQIHVRQQ
jgi:hypothetical protein